MSLKKTLNEIIEARGGQVFTLKELETFCHEAGYKISNAERRLRESTNIEKVWNDKKTAIIGYKYKAWWNEEKYKKTITPPETPQKGMATLFGTQTI